MTKLVPKIITLVAVIMFAFITNAAIENYFTNLFVIQQMTIDGGQVYYEVYENLKTVTTVLYGILILLLGGSCVHDVIKNFQKKKKEVN